MYNNFINNFINYLLLALLLTTAVFIIRWISYVIYLALKHGKNHYVFYIQASTKDFVVCKVPIRRGDLIHLYNRTDDSYIDGEVIGKTVFNYIVFRDDKNERVHFYNIDLIETDDFEVVKR